MHILELHSFLDIGVLHDAVCANRDISPKLERGVVGAILPFYDAFYLLL